MDCPLLVAIVGADGSGQAQEKRPNIVTFWWIPSDGEVSGVYGGLVSHNH